VRLLATARRRSPEVLIRARRAVARDRRARAGARLLRARDRARARRGARARGLGDALAAERDFAGAEERYRAALAAGPDDALVELGYATSARGTARDAAD
jgi:tetratricopeptide (TPR) repeat protein